MRKHILRLSTRLSFTVLLLGLLCTFSFAHGNAQIRTSTDKAAQTVYIWNVFTAGRDLSSHIEDALEK